MCNNNIRIAIPAPEKDVPNYLDALRALGATPVLVNPDCDAAAFDGLLLPGGVDVDPLRYGCENTASHVDPDLDAWQWKVLEKFVALSKPVFGICRGHQLINVYFGGTLIQHIDCADRHAQDAGTHIDKVHATHADPGRFIAELYGTNFSTNSSHHQAVDRLGKGLCIVQRSAEGIAEAMYHVVLPVWSVQWHPERMCFAFRRDDTADGSIVLKWFLEKCAQRKTNS